MDQKLIFTNDVAGHISRLLAELRPDRVFAVADENSYASAWPAVADAAGPQCKCIVLAPGEEQKSLGGLNDVWTFLSRNGATRRSLLLCLGGGMITDLGGFAAATFKRGIRFVNLPTTLLGAVDAAVGGKTGINLDGLKNEVGAFAPASAVVISTRFFSTLPRRQLLSGYAEMLKHGILDKPDTLARLLAMDIAGEGYDADRLLDLVRESVLVKKSVVDADPTESGPRKALNLGHTVGHAFESLAMHRHEPVPHGYAVAWGLVAELVLSHMLCGLPSSTLSAVASYVRDNYGAFPITCDDYPQLIELMRHDKKNSVPGQINFTLMADVGRPLINQSADQHQIEAALDIFRDLLD